MSKSVNKIPEVLQKKKGTFKYHFDNIREAQNLHEYYQNDT